MKALITTLTVSLLFTSSLFAQAGVERKEGFIPLLWDAEQDGCSSSSRASIRTSSISRRSPKAAARVASVSSGPAGVKGESFSFSASVPE